MGKKVINLWYISVFYKIFIFGRLTKGVIAKIPKKMYVPIF